MYFHLPGIRSPEHAVTYQTWPEFNETLKDSHRKDRGTRGGAVGGVLACSGRP